jgi:hypothetical protein
MKKEEFPTFLNEQPTIIFNRTGRELLIILIGLGFGYLTWTSLSGFMDDLLGDVIASNIIKGILAACVVAASGVVALVKIATRPLEEWGLAWVFYTLIPKVYFYMPEEESVLPDDSQGSSLEKNRTVAGRADDEYSEDD